MQNTKGENKCLILQNDQTLLRSLTILKTIVIGVVSTVIDLMKPTSTIMRAVFGKHTAVNAVKNKNILKRDQGNINLAKGVVA